MQEFTEGVASRSQAVMDHLSSVRVIFVNFQYFCVFFIYIFVHLLHNEHPVFFPLTSCLHMMSPNRLKFLRFVNQKARTA